MPIRAENLARYPAEWPRIRLAILERAGHRCEGCGVENGAIGYRDARGDFHDVGPLLDQPKEDVVTPPGTRVIRIVLTVAHLNHRPEDCRPENLRAWCQRCHNRYDLPARIRGRRARRAAAQGQDTFRFARGTWT